jgi:hypothetical protein
VVNDLLKEKKILYCYPQFERTAQHKAQKTGGAAQPIREFFAKYVEASLSKKVAGEVLELVKREGLRIIDEVEAERSR